MVTVVNSYRDLRASVPITVNKPCNLLREAEVILRTAP